ncbi:MAG: hypothetical protein HY547_02630 [Elusimicrobia bacterium]|nr:hypothetical protein [Elusimicrobiota bacterium]
MKDKKIRFFLWTIAPVTFAGPLWAALSTGTIIDIAVPALSSAGVAAVELSTDMVLSRALAFDRGVERAILRFDEEFILTSTGEKERLSGKVYFDRKTSKARVDYSGRAKYRVWLDAKNIHFYDLALKQVVIRSWEKFAEAHFQAFLDLPILTAMPQFIERYEWSLGTAPEGELAGQVRLGARPKKRSVPYELLFWFDVNSGRLSGLELMLEGYHAKVKITDLQSPAKFKDEVFTMNFPSDVNVLDLTKN